jgi:hypothetical protein
MAVAEAQTIHRERRFGVSEAMRSPGAHASTVAMLSKVFKDTCAVLLAHMWLIVVGLTPARRDNSRCERPATSSNSARRNFAAIGVDVCMVRT